MYKQTTKRGKRPLERSNKTYYFNAEQGHIHFSDENGKKVRLSEYNDGKDHLKEPFTFEQAKRIADMQKVFLKKSNFN